VLLSLCEKKLDCCKNILRGLGSDKVKLLKIDTVQQVVFAVVLEPDTVDLQGDIISAEEIEKACWKYNTESRVVGFRHQKELDAVILESSIVRGEGYYFDKSVTANGESAYVKVGSWVAAIKINDSEIWDGIMRGEYRSFSVGGFTDSEIIDPAIIATGDQGGGN